MAAAPVRDEIVVLLVDDDPFIREFLPLLVLRGAPPGTPLPRIEVAQAPEEALALSGSLKATRLVVVSDFDLKTATTGLDLLVEMARRRPDSVRILLSGHRRVELGSLVDHPEHVQCFLEKPFKLQELIAPLWQAILTGLATRDPRQGS
ncbi:MAG TPA: hypothetical protein VM370_10710 [Candidatus Thermoplasmatota archaeon]|nr:hypothetical protein [Candidatus Thermoplasmatota archaeon]